MQGDSPGMHGAGEYREWIEVSRFPAVVSISERRFDISCVSQAEEAELARCLVEVLDGATRQFCEQVVAEVSMHECGSVAREAVEEAALEQLLLDGLCREEVDRLTQSVLLECVANVARSADYYRTCLWVGKAPVSGSGLGN